MNVLNKQSRLKILWTSFVITTISCCRAYPTPTINSKVNVDFPEQDSLKQFFLEEINANEKVGRFPSKVHAAFCTECDYHFHTLGVRVIDIHYTRKRQHLLLFRPDGVMKIGDNYYPVKYDNLSSFLKSRNLDQLTEGNSYLNRHLSDSFKKFVFAGIGDEYFFTSWDLSSARGTNSVCPKVEISNFPTQGFSERELDSVKITPFTRGSNFTKTFISFTTSNYRYNEVDSTSRVYYSLTSEFDYEILIANKYKYKLSEIMTKKISSNERSRCTWSELKLNGKLLHYEDFIITKPK